MNQLFDLCVELLLWLAGMLGLTYEAINIWIFCVIWPLLSVVAIIYIVVLRRRVHQRECEILALNCTIDESTKHR